jgi:hypothetical protein
VTVPSLKRIFKLGLPRHLDNNNNNNDGMNLCASLHPTLNRRLSLADHWRKRGKHVGQLAFPAFKVTQTKIRNFEKTALEPCALSTCRHLRNSWSGEASPALGLGKGTWGYLRLTRQSSNVCLALQAFDATNASIPTIQYVVVNVLSWPYVWVSLLSFCTTS